MHRRSLDRPDQFYQPGQRADGRVRRREFRVRPFLAEPAGLHVDKAGMFPLERGEIEWPDNPPHRCRGRRAKCRSRRSVRQTRCRVRLRRIEHDARFVEIEKREPGALALSASAAQCGAADHPAAVRPFEPSRRNRQTDAHNSSSQQRSRSRQLRRCDNAPITFPHCQISGAAFAPGSAFCCEHETLPGCDASGILFHDDGIRKTARIAPFLSAIQLHFEPVLQRSRKRPPGTLQCRTIALRWRGRCRATPSRSPEDRRRCSDPR